MQEQLDAPHPEDDADATEADDLEQEVVEGDGGEQPGSQEGAASPEEAPEKDPERERARETGWKPRDEWPGEPPKGFIEDPAEWNRRQDTLAVANRRLEDELKKVNAGVDQKVARATDRAVKAAKAAFDRQLRTERETLEARFDHWIAEGGKPEEIRARIADKREALAKADEKAAKARAEEFGDAAETPPNTEPPMAYTEFVERNKSWYGANKGITARAWEIAVDVETAPGFSGDLDEAFKEVERRVREEYADHPVFRAPKRTAPKVTSVATNGGRGLNGGAAPQMTEEDKQAFDIIFRQGGYGPPRTTDRKKAMAEYLEDTKEG